MRPRPQRAPVSCLALIIAGAVAPSALAQSPIDVPTIVSVPPHDDAFNTPAPAVPPWDAPAAPRTTQPRELATAAPPRPAPVTAFAGSAAPLTCRAADYCLIIDEHSALHLGTLCRMPDGAWQLLP